MLVDRNLIAGTWDMGGGQFECWDEDPGGPKRNLRTMADIAEFVVDRSSERMAWTLGVDIAMSDPTGMAPDR